MGCIEAIIEEVTKLKKRKTFKEFKTGNDLVANVFPIEKYKKIAIVVVSKKIVFLDYSAEKMKVKYEASLGPAEILSQDFSESTDIFEIKYRCLEEYILYKFKISSDKITEVSKDIIGKVPKSDDPSIEILKTLENGNSIVFRPNEFQTAEDRYLSLVDKNFKVICETEVNKKLNLVYTWSNDKYVAITEYTTQMWMGKDKSISEAIHLYRLDNFSKVGTMKIEKVNGKFLEHKKILIFPANDTTLIISLYGIMYIVDIETMKTRKKINLGEAKTVIQIVKDKNDSNIFYSMSEIGSLFKWTLDGSILVKNTGPCACKFHLINNQKELVSDFYLCGVVIQSVEETE